MTVSPVTVKITKLFHKDSDGGAVARGMSFNETMTFVSFEEAEQWAVDINKRYLDLPYHITCVWMDNGNWAMLDIREIWDWAESQPGDWMAD